MGGVSSIQVYFGFKFFFNFAKPLLKRLSGDSLTARWVAERPFTVHCDVLFRRISRFMTQLSPSTLNLQRGEFLTD